LALLLLFLLANRLDFWNVLVVLFVFRAVIGRGLRSARGFDVLLATDRRRGRFRRRRLRLRRLFLFIRHRRPRNLNASLAARTDAGLAAILVGNAQLLVAIWTRESN